ITKSIAVPAEKGVVIFAQRLFGNCTEHVANASDGASSGDWQASSTSRGRGFFQSPIGQQIVACVWQLAIQSATL
ncbi:MAG TPA: hypothetical protein P5528_14060, partial [Steroidobacteraceae bacterium]|nr:hypothetical protein [Steroidobacteraceae bacterium]